MHVLLIIQELHGLARDSIQGYEKVMAVWTGRPELEEIENQQVSRRVILQELRKTIERYKGDTNGMAPSEGYRAISERQISGHPSEIRGVLDDLLRGENYYLYRIDDARTRYPAVAAHLTDIHSTIRDNRDVLAGMLAREENVSSISIAHPGGDIEDQAPQPAVTEDDAPIMAAPISSMDVDAPHVSEPMAPAQPAHDLVQASDAEIPPSFRQSAAGEAPDLSEADEVDPLPAWGRSTPGAALELDREAIFEVSGEPIETAELEAVPRREPETEIDLLPTDAIDYALNARPIAALDNNFEVDESVNEIGGADIALERRVDAAMPNIAPLDPAGGRRNIMTRRGRFDADAVHDDANDVEAAVRQI